MTDSLLNEAAPKAALEATAFQCEQDPLHDALMMDNTGQTQIYATKSSCTNESQSDNQEQHSKAVPERKNRRTQNEERTTLTSSPESEVPFNPSEVYTPSPYFHDPEKKPKARVAEEIEQYARALWRNTSAECQLTNSQNEMFSPRLRAILIDWLAELCQALHFHRRTISVAVNLVDTFLIKRGSVSKGELQLWGATALYVAGKQEEAYAPSMGDFLDYVVHTITKRQLLECEKTLVLLANWNTNPATSYDWLSFMLHQLGSIASNIRTNNYYTCDPLDEACICCDEQAAVLLHGWSAEMLFNVTPDIAEAACPESPCNLPNGEIFVPLEAVGTARKHISCENFLKATHILDLVRMDAGFLQYSSPVIAYSILATLLPTSISRVFEQVVASIVEPFFPSLRSHSSEAKSWVRRIVGKACPKYFEHPQLKQLASRHVVHHRDLHQLQQHNPELQAHVTNEKEDVAVQPMDVDLDLLPSMASVSTISRYIKNQNS